MRILIVEDEENIAQYISNLVENHPANLTSLGYANNLAEAEIMIRNTNPDVVLFDINLPDGDAFSLLNKLEEIPFQIIFITAYNEYAIQAIKLGALDYLLKPFDQEEFYTALEKLDTTPNFKEQIGLTSAYFEQENLNRIAIKQQHTISIVHFDKLLYCKSDGPYTEFHLEDNQVICASSTLKEYEQLLPSHFVRTHKSYVVNFNKVKQFNKTSNELLLLNGSLVPVSLRKKNEVVSFLLR